MFDLVRVLRRKNETDVTALESKWGAWVRKYDLVNDPKEADFAALPYSWNHYRLKRNLAAASLFVDMAHQHGLHVASVVDGDLGVRVPRKDILVIRASGYASRRDPHQHAAPVFIRDPVTWLDLDSVVPSSPSPVSPKVAFCGFAGREWWRPALDTCHTLFRNLSFHAGFGAGEPQPLTPPSRLRLVAMRNLEAHPDIETDFVIRPRGQYHARNRGPEDRAQLMREYFDNMLRCDYVLCVRGTGNFSKRFYETLACGRIPVFVDTDCVLPYDSVIDWRSLCVWVEEKDLPKIGTIVAEAHARFSGSELRERQRECRRIWVRYLSLNGFYSHFDTLMRLIVTQAPPLASAFLQTASTSPRLDDSKACRHGSQPGSR